MKYWLTAIVVITIFAGLVYTTAQQVLRIGANDPQIQIAEDTAVALSNSAYSLPLLRFRVDIENSLDTFKIVYNEAGKVTNSTGILNGRVPELPDGVLSYVKQKGEDRITWEPKNNVRIAAVIRRYQGGYVLVGRSLREVEKREDNLLAMVIAAWVVATFIATIPFTFYAIKRKK
jgi:hypothetical protein